MAIKANGTLKLIIAIIGACSILVCGAIGYGRLGGQVDEIDKRTNVRDAEHTVRIDANAAINHEQDKAIVGMTKDLDYLKRAALNQEVDTAYNEALLKDILIEVRK